MIYSLVNPPSLDMLTSNDPPTIVTAYPILTALECLSGIVDCINFLATSTLTTSDQKVVCAGLASAAWPAVDSVLGILLSKTQDEVITDNWYRFHYFFIYAIELQVLSQTVLNVYMSFANTCASLNLSTPRDAIITTLARFKPPNKTTPYFLILTLLLQTSTTTY